MGTLENIAKGALLLIGVGALAKFSGAGVGLGQTGAGLAELVAAPGVGIGAGLAGTASGVRSIAEALGDVGRGLSSLFQAIPGLGTPMIPSPGGEQPGLTQYPGITVVSTSGTKDIAMNTTYQKTVTSLIKGLRM